MRNALAARLAKLEAVANPPKRYAFIPYDRTMDGPEAVKEWQAEFMRGMNPATQVIFFQWREADPVGLR